MEMTSNAELNLKQGAPGVSITAIRMDILGFEERIRKELK